MRRRTTYVLIGLAAIAIATLALERASMPPVQLAPPPVAATIENATFPGSLPIRVLSSETAGLFYAPPPQQTGIAAPQPVFQLSEPTPPPMPYRFVGRFAFGSSVEYLLMKGDSVFAVKEGDILDAAYRVEGLTGQEVKLIYLPLDVSINLALASPQTFSVRGPAWAAPSAVAPQTPGAVSPASSAVSQVNTPTSTLAVSKTSGVVTAESGTRAAHLRREQMQQLPPLPPSSR